MFANPIFSEPGAPAQVTELLAAYYEAVFDATGDAQTATDAAYRHLRHSGWYRTEKGWEQLGPDVRDKVNIRKAVKQPDGRYMVRDVDVFYPNAVKGENQFTPDRIEQIIKNTNAGIFSGGQRPNLTKGHPDPQMARITGRPEHAFGSAINFRLSPRGGGQVRCDVVDVPEEMVKEWSAGRFTGLSAGIVSDAGNLNTRFGHVAALGGESQALSHLPLTEIYSHDNQVCFSAENTMNTDIPVDFFSTDYAGSAHVPAWKKIPLKDLKGRHLASYHKAIKSREANLKKNDPGIRNPIKHSADADHSTETSMPQFTSEQFRTLKDHFASLSAAYAAAEAGEPNYESKVKEAYSAYESFASQFDCDGDGDEGSHDDEKEDRAIVRDEMQKAEGKEKPSYSSPPVDTGTGQGPHESTRLPAKPQLTDTGNQTDNDELAIPGKGNHAMPSTAQFSAMQAQFQELNQLVKQQEQQLSEATRVIQALHARQLREGFADFSADLRRKGHALPDEATLASLYADCKNDADRVAMLKKMMQASPKSARSLAEFDTFGASSEGQMVAEFAAKGAGADLDNAQVRQLLNKYTPGVDFTEDDLNFGAIAGG